MKLFIPTTKDRFRLVDDWPDAFYDYDAGKKVTLPAGSIVSFDGIKVNKLTKPDARLHLTIRVHAADPTKTMKKYGGKAPYGYSTYLTIAELRNLDLELVEDMP